MMSSSRNAWSRRFAASRNRDKRRKDQAASPYINHLIEVAYILWEVGGVREESVLVAAILHDVLRHRIAISYRAEAEGLNSDALLDRIVERVPINDVGAHHAAALD